MNPLKRWMKGASWAMAATLCAACGGGSRCPVGRTPTENGTCVDQRVVDFVACIDRANGSERHTANGTKLSADVRAVSVGVATATEFQQAVSTRVYAGSDAQGQQILAACNGYVFGGAQAGGGGPPSASWGGPTGPAAPYPASGYPPPPFAPSFAPSAASCGTSIAVPTDNTWSLREREQWGELAKTIQTTLNSVVSSCGGPIGGAFVFETFRGHFVPERPTGLDYAGVEHARAPFTALMQICGDGEMQKSAVRAKIRCIEVRYGNGGRSSWSLSGPVLVGNINPAGGSDLDFWRDMRGPTGIRRAL